MKQSPTRIIRLAGLFLFLFSVSVNAEVIFDTAIFTSQVYPGETQVYTNMLKNTNTIPSLVFVRTEANNTSCLLDNGLAYMNFTLHPQSNRTITIFHTIPKDAIPQKYSCFFNMNATEPDPEPVHSSTSGGGGGGGGGASYTTAPSVFNKPFCDIPISDTGWGACEGNMQKNIYTITKADCSQEYLTVTRKCVPKTILSAPATTEAAITKEEGRVVQPQAVVVPIAKKWLQRLFFALIVALCFIVGKLWWDGRSRHPSVVHKRFEKETAGIPSENKGEDEE